MYIFSLKQLTKLLQTSIGNIAGNILPLTRVLIIDQCDKGR